MGRLYIAQKNGKRIRWLLRQTKAYWTTMPIVLETLHKTPPIVSYIGIIRLLEATIVAIRHDASVGESLG